MFDYPIDLQHGAGPLLALLPEPDPATLAECAVALANTDGGTIVLGIYTDGAPADPPDLDTCHHWLDQAAERCQPAGLFGPREIIATPAGPRLAQRIHRTGQVHALNDGRVLLRAGKRNRILNGREIRELISLRTIGDFDAEDVPGATLDDLDETLVRSFARSRAAQTGTRWHGSFADLLIASGALHDDYRVTVAGMLLFGRNPQHWLPHSRTHFQHYTGPADAHPVLAAQIPVDGALTRVIDGTADLVAAHMRTRTITGETAADYDLNTVRAALVNAVAHRDYRLRQGPVTVQLYTNRLVITSPGDPAPVLTWDASGFPRERFSVNPRLAFTLHQWGYSGLGSGLSEIRAALAVHHLHPTVSTDQHAFTLTIPAARTTSAGNHSPAVHDPARDLGGKINHTANDTTNDSTNMTSNAGTSHESAPNSLPPNASTPNEFIPNDRQARALEHVAAHGSITAREFYTLCRNTHNTVRRDLLQQELDALVDHDCLIKIDARGGSYYIAP